MTEGYLTAEAASEALGISRATLYAYVSRGMIRSEPGDNRSRARRYSAADIQRLKAQQEQRRNPGQAIEGALSSGAPLLESALTLISPEGLFYRGYNVLQLATHASVEQVATLLWAGELPGAGSGPFVDLTELALQTLPVVELDGLAPIQRFQVLLALAAANDRAAYDLRPLAVARAGVRILQLMISDFTGATVAGTPLALALQRRWAPDNLAAVRLFDTALILCADHELNVSAFTARCVASAGSTPYDVVLAGLAALQGVRHGGQTERVEALLREVVHPEYAHATLAGRLRRGETIPGFGHVLYPNGDPRGAALLRQIALTCPEAPATALVQTVVEEVTGLIGEYPTIDLALAALAAALEMPPGSALALFALSRSIGWIAHAIEEYGQGRIFRPRARYTGEPPRAG